MSYADLTTADWNGRSDESATNLATAIAERADVRLVRVYGHEYVGGHHRVALFERHGVHFSLVPGGRVSLGYDSARFVPTPQQAESYAETADEYGLPPLSAFVDEITSPVRVVDLPAMLVGVDAVDPCLQELSHDDPRVLALTTQVGGRKGGVMTFLPDGGGLKVAYDETGAVRAARLTRQVSYDDAMTLLAGSGLRPSTPDEWEYACGAGTRTLFRWGDDTPDDDDPYGHTTGPHRVPNLWGLTIGQDPYKHEFTTERTIVCGGDGGGAICGGSGYFFSWLTLATAYRNLEFGEWLASDNGYADEILIRPIIDLE